MDIKFREKTDLVLFLDQSVPSFQNVLELQQLSELKS